MEIEINSNDDKKYLLTTIMGEISISDLKQILNETSNYDKKTKYGRYFVDLSGTIINSIGNKNIIKNSSIMKHFGFCKDSKIAVLHDGQESIYAILKLNADANNFNIELFKSKKNALSWLTKENLLDIQKNNVEDEANLNNNNNNNNKSNSNNNKEK